VASRGRRLARWHQRPQHQPEQISLIGDANHVAGVRAFGGDPHLHAGVILRADRARSSLWRPRIDMRPVARQPRVSEPLPVAAPRLGRRTALTFPLLPPPQKNRSPPSDSSPETPTPDGISSFSRTSPVRGSTRLTSLSSPSQVPRQSSPSTHVTPVTKRLDSIVRRIAPVSGSI
jgi:hypothetical protein